MKPRLSKETPQDRVIQDGDLISVILC